MSSFPIRMYGDPVLRQKVDDVTDIDGTIARLVDDMFETMREAEGTGLAANQIGVQRRVFVYATPEEKHEALINAHIVESSGEWTFDEGCLSVPGLRWPIVRPKQVHVVGLDLEGNEVSIEADEFEARVLQHELDHLDGILLVERLDDDQRREAKRVLRGRALNADPDGLLDA